MFKPRTLSDWLILLEARHPVVIDLGLERIGQVWNRLGRPRPAQTLVTVAGTNGKGSTVAYTCAMLRGLGFSEGSYTSPHLFEYNERVLIRGRPVPDAAWIAAFEQVQRACGEISLSYFEFGTLAAFLLLAQARLEYAVLEVGLGGRLDAVNLLDADCAAITTIGLDHQEYLGDDLDSIAREKSGIMRPGRPVVCAEPEPPVGLLESARTVGASLLLPGRDYAMTCDRHQCDWCMNDQHIHLPRPPLGGPHQQRNLAAAMTILAVLMPDSVARWGVDSTLLRDAIDAVRLPGRLESAAADRRVLIDVGHNSHAAQAVAIALQSGAISKLDCVLGMLRDKDAIAVTRALVGCVDDWYCAGLQGARGRSGEQLAAEVATVCGAARTRSFANVGEALHAALEAAGPSDRILVFGSFVTAAQAYNFLSCGQRGPA